MAKNQENKRSSRNIQNEFLFLLEEGLRTAGRITKREFDRVSDMAREKLEKKYGKEKVQGFQDKIKENWEETVEKIQSAGRNIHADDSFRKGKEVSVQILTGLADAIRRAAENLEASLSDKVTYHAGQMVDKGVFLCNNCRKIQEIKRRKKLIVCPECGGSEFRMA